MRTHRNASLAINHIFIAAAVAAAAATDFNSSRRKRAVGRSVGRRARSLGYRRSDRLSSAIVQLFNIRQRSGGGGGHAAFIGYYLS